MQFFSSKITIKFRYSEKTTKLWPIFYTFLTVLISVKFKYGDLWYLVKFYMEAGTNFCGLLRIYELQESDFLTSRLVKVFLSDTFLFYKSYKLFNPNHFFIYRGNHESENMNKMYGFEGEVKAKYSANMVDIFTEVYNWLPLCHCINDRVLVMHGGLFAKVNT